MRNESARSVRTSCEAAERHRPSGGPYLSHLDLAFPANTLLTDGRVSDGFPESTADAPPWAEMWREPTRAVTETLGGGGHLTGRLDSPADAQMGRMTDRWTERRED